MKTINKQIKELKAEDAFKKLTQKKLKKIDNLTYISCVKKVINAKCKSFLEAKTVLNAFPPTNKQTIIGTATDKYHSKLKTPFKITIHNPCQPSNSFNFEIQISYNCEDIDANITLPIELIKEFVITSSRSVTDSEYHYFIGYSIEKLRQLKCMQYEFKGVLNDECINWYGGDKTLTKTKMIEDIMNTIIN